MTVTEPTNSAVEQAEKLVTLTIDGFEVSVPEGTLLIRAAEMLGIQIPRFCDHPLLDPVGACRQCLVEVVDDGRGRGMPKPQASCTTTVMPGMVVKTQLTSPVADKAQQGIMEFLLINHPLDCPVCDKGGECPLQNQAMSNGRGESRYEGKKRTYPKPIAISSQVLLDRERCVLCARCTRFSNEIAGDPFIEMLERGALQQVGIYESEPFESYFSGNTIQICPVGALTSAAYRFRARPFDLVSVPSVTEHDSSGAAIRVDQRRNVVMRRLAGDDPEVNEEWISDKDRFAFRYANLDDRLTYPLVRDDETGQLVPTSWPDALAVAAEGLRAARAERGVGVLTGGRLTVEDAYAYAKFARLVLRTNDIDFRARVHSAEEAEFLAAVAGSRMEITYADLEKAPAVLLAGLEAEEEAPTIFLRLRKGVRRGGTVVASIAPFGSRGLEKLSGRLIPVVPGGEAEALASDEVAALMREPSSVILVGERLAGTPGALSAAAALAASTGARLAWVPRRAGDRGAVEAGALPILLPGGRLVENPEARIDVSAVWGVAHLPPLPGRDTASMVTALADSQLSGVVVGGVELADLPDPAAARDALRTARFVVSLEVLRSEVTELADVVFPVAPVVEKAGTFVNWEGRDRPFPVVLESTNALADAKVLTLIADEFDIDLGLSTIDEVRSELAEVGAWDGERPEAPAVRPGEPRHPESGQALLATWRLLLDDGRLQAGEPHLAGTARRPVARLSAGTAADTGVDTHVTVATEHGAITLPVEITDMPDRVVWVPQYSPGSHVHDMLRAAAGDVVELRAADGPPTGSGGTATDGSALGGAA
ncbi:MAG TPA: NADH-quinone oxidoreductase subunit G [Jiangellaceae bacterium]|nr:NADH-quinone oxidoreductase subunit G [Jiangellaceae bacterium]